MILMNSAYVGLVSCEHPASPAKTPSIPAIDSNNIVLPTSSLFLSKNSRKWGPTQRQMPSMPFPENTSSFSTMRYVETWLNLTSRSI